MRRTCRSGHTTHKTDKPPRTHRRGEIQPHVFAVHAGTQAYEGVLHLDRRVSRKRPLLAAVASRGKNAVLEDQCEPAGGDEGAWKRGSADVDDPAEKDEERPDDGACRGSLEPPKQRDSDSTGSDVIPEPRRR